MADQKQDGPKPNPTYICRDYGREVPVKDVTISLSASKRCPQCYTKHILEYEGGGIER